MCEPKEIGAMFQAGTIFLFNAVLRQPQIIEQNYLGDTFTMCSILTQPRAAPGSKARDFREPLSRRETRSLRPPIF